MTKAAKKESFETSLEQLEALVRQLESGEKGLEESLEVFENGVTLARALSQQLEDAKAKVEILVKAGGKVSKKPLPEEEGGD